MKKLFNFRGLKRVSLCGSKNSRVSASGPRYCVQCEDLGKLHTAADMGDVPEVQRLLSLHPECLNDRDKMKRTALHLACANGHLGVATLLADSKCHMSLHDNEGRTALIKAIQCGEDECATLLLERGADPDIKDTKDNSALHYAILNENIAMATKLLLHKADIEARNKNGLTPFLLAVSENKQQMVEFLLKRNANIHALDKIRRTALMLAVSDKSSKIVRLLLQQGVDVFAQDVLGRTADGTAYFRGTKKNFKLISDYQQERRCKESSEKSNLAFPCKPSTEHVDHFTGAAEPRGDNTLSGQEADVDLQKSPKQVLRKTNATAAFPCKPSTEHVDHFTGAAEPRGNNTLSGQEADSPETYPHLEPVVEVKDPHPNKTVVVTKVRPYISDIDLQEYPEQVSRNTIVITVKDSKQNQQREKVYGTVLKKPGTSFQESSPYRVTVAEYSKNISGSSLFSIPGIGGSWSTPEDKDFGVDTKEGAPKPAIGKKINGMDIIESAPQEQTHHNNLTHVDGAHKSNRSVKGSALRLGEEEDRELPWDSESFSASLPQKHVDHFSGSSDQRGKNKLNGHVEDSLETYPHLEPAIEVKDPDPKKIVGMKTVVTSITDVDSLVPPEEVSRITNLMTGAECSKSVSTSSVSPKPGIDDSWSTSEDDDFKVGTKSFSASHPQKHVDHFSGSSDQRGKNKLNGQVEDSPETYPHLEPAIEVKDPDPKKTGIMKTVVTSISDVDPLVPPEEVSRITNLMTVKASKQNQQREKVCGTVWKKPGTSFQGSSLYRLTGAECSKKVSTSSVSPKPGIDDSWSTSEDDDFKVGTKSFSASHPQKHVDHFSGSSDQRGKNKLNGQVEDSPETYPHLEPAIEVKDPDPKKTGIMKTVVTSISDVDPLVPPEEVSRITNLMTVKASKQNQQREKVCGTVWKKPGTSFQGSSLYRLTGAECSKKVSTSSVSPKPGIDDSWSTSEDDDFKVGTKEGAPKPAIGKKINGMDIIESAPQEQTHHDNLTYVDGAHKSNRSVKLSALGLGEEEDRESPWDSESFSASLPQKHVDHFSGSSDQRGKNKLNGQVEDSPETYPHMEPAFEVKDPDPNRSMAVKNVQTSTSELHLGRTSEEEQEHLDGTENNHPHVVQEQRPLAQERNDRILKDAILTNDLCKKKETEIDLKKINSEVSESRDLLHEIAKLKLESSTVKSQHQAMEKQYCEDIAIVKEKNACLQKKIKMNEETIFQYKGQLNVLTAENTMLNSKLGNEKQKEVRLKTEAESYHLRLLTAATHDYEQSQKSIRSLQVAFQGARDECFHLQDKMNLHMSILKDNNETLLQRLSKVENKFNSLETELHHTRDAVTERTLVLERVQRDLSQTQRQKEEIEHMYQTERGKVNTCMRRLESLEERFSHLESENMLLRQQLDDARKTSNNNEKRGNEIQDRLQDIVKKFQTEYEKQGGMLEERDKQLILELKHLKERMYQYEKDKAEREVAVRQLQELADSVKNLLMSQASLEYTSRYRMHLEAETQDLKKTSEHVRSHSQDEKEQLKNYIELNQSLEYRLDQEKKKTGELEKEMTKFKQPFKIIRRELNESENEDLSFSEDLKPNQIDMDIQINRLKQKIDDLTAELETASSERKHLNEKTEYLQQELLSLKGIQKKCEKLEKKKKGLKQELLNLKCHMTTNMVENSEVEHYKREIEERARLDVAEKFKEVNVFLQGQAASQEYFDQLRENNNAAMKSQMELRLKDLELEFSKVKTSADDSKVEVEKYKQLYLEEIKVRTSLENQLNKNYKRLAEISTELAVKERQNALLSTTITRPVLEPPCVGSLSNSSVLNRSPAPRENLVISTSTPRKSNNNVDDFLAKIEEEFHQKMTRELKKDAANYEYEPYRRFSLVPTDDLVKNASKEYVQILNERYML